MVLHLDSAGSCYAAHASQVLVEKDLSSEGFATEVAFERTHVSLII